MTAVTTSDSSACVTVLPGDNVTEYIRSTKHIKIGDGLRYDKEKIIATCAGRLKQHRQTWFVMTNNKRYLPANQDRVVGIVLDRAGSDGQGGDLYRLNIGGPHPALLSNLDFEGATKRNKPSLGVGALVYGRVTSTTLDPVLSCKLGPRDVNVVQRKDWMTQEGLYGELKGGTLEKIPLGLARELLSPHSVVLAELSKLPFEVCIGVNGYLWIHSERAAYTILVANAIRNSQVLTPEQTRSMVRSLVRTVQGHMSKEDSDA